MVLHLAAETAGLRRLGKVMAITIGGALNVFRAAQEAGVWRVVFMSSGSTMCGYEWYEGSPYGKLARNEIDRLPADAPMITHPDPPRPDSFYAVGKLFGENTGRLFSDRYGMSVLCIRLGAVLPDDRPALIRHFPGYLSQADAVQMIDKCLSARRCRSSSTSSTRSRRTRGAGATPATPKRCSAGARPARRTISTSMS